MWLDHNGLELSAPNATAVESFGRSLDRLVHFEYNMVEPLLPTLSGEGNFPMAEVFNAYLGGLSTDAHLVSKAAVKFSSFLQSSCAYRLTPHERGHAEAASLLLTGNLTAASRALAAVSTAYPRDVLALAVGHHVDYLLGDSMSLRDRIGAALPFWSPQDIHFPAVLGMYAFGLEECGHWEYAGETGMKAVELDPSDVWAVHAVAHSRESRSQFRKGLTWLDAQRNGWDTQNQMRVHIVWHYCLFLLETGNPDAVLDHYDHTFAVGLGESTIRPFLDASSLLWRLHLQGVDVASRFKSLAQDWSPRVGEAWSAFNDLHAVMCYVGAGDVSTASALISDRRRYVAETASEADNVAVTAEIGLPMFESLVAFGEGRYDEVLRLLYPTRRTLYRCGGSHAQRDVIHQTLLEAALRGGWRDQARALVGERIAIRPRSPFNWVSYGKLAAASGDCCGAQACQQEAQRLATADEDDAGHSFFGLTW